MKVLKSGNQKITFYYGKNMLNRNIYNHKGIDLVKKPSSLDYIVAAERGKVKKVIKNIKGFKENSYGNYVLLEHSNNIQTLYAHMEKGSITCKEGDIIEKGEVIGYMGETGYAFGKHLHFEVIVNEKNANPLLYLNDEKKIYPFEEDNKYTIGNYITKDIMRVRNGAGTNFKQIKVKDLTEDGKENATTTKKEALAAYKKGTVFTALEIINGKDNSVWARTPSGYVCIKDNKQVYCEKV